MMILKTDDEAFDETDSKVKDELLRQLANCRTAFLKNILEISWKLINILGLTPQSSGFL